MERQSMNAVIFSIVASVSTMTGGLAAAKLQGRSGVLAAFVAGVLIAVPLFHLLPFFAGGFLYLGAGDLLPEAHEKNPPLVSLLAALTGFVLIFVVVQIL
jgi:zinc transporter ZupT